MATQKIREAAKRWAARQLKPIETLAPKDANWRVALAYMEGYDRGKRDQRNHDRPQRLLPHPGGCCCAVCDP